MPTLAISLDKEAEPLMKAMNDRLQENDFTKNPFYGSVREYKEFWLITMRPIYPQVFYAAIFPLLPAIVFGWLWAWIVAGIMALTYIFWNSYFYYFMVRLMLIKGKYEGKVKWVNKDKIIEVLANGTN